MSDTDTQIYSSPREAAEASIRERDAAAEKTPAVEKTPEPAPVSPPPEPAVSENAAPPVEEAPSEEATQQPDPAELPPIEPPRSWSKEDKELFASLPRETQERVAERETERDKDFRRRQNEAAEQNKAAQAKLVQAEQARQQYEAALPQLNHAIQTAIQTEFADIRSDADIQKLAAEDPARYVRFDAQVKRANLVASQLAAAQKRQAQEDAAKWADYAREQDNKISELVPELADAEKAAALRRNAKKTLADVGYTDQELETAFKGQAGVYMKDHRFQMLVLKASKYDAMEAKAKAISQKPVPPVQKPGTARPAGSAAQADVISLNKQLETASGNAAIRIAAKLAIAEKKASAR